MSTPNNLNNLNKSNTLNVFNELSEHIALHIHSCNEASHPAGWLESNRHSDYDIWLLQKGQIEFRVHDYVGVAAEGDLVFFNPKVAYTASTWGSGCRFIYVHFDFGLGNQLKILDNFQLSGIIPGELVQEETQLFLSAYDQHKRRASMSGIRMKGCFTILIARIMERYGSGDYRGGFLNRASEPSQSKNFLALEPVFEFIHEHLNLPIRIQELAALAGMSEKYFFTYFKQAIGITPGLYIYQLKMNHARELLYSKQQYSIQQIAGMLGYPDPYSFSKAFKKYYKVPPSQFV